MQIRMQIANATVIYQKQVIASFVAPNKPKMHCVHWIHLWLH